MRRRLSRNDARKKKEKSQIKCGTHTRMAKNMSYGCLLTKFSGARGSEKGEGVIGEWRWESEWRVEGHQGVGHNWEGYQGVTSP